MTADVSAITGNPGDIASLTRQGVTNEWRSGNVLVGGIIGGAVDASSGALNDLKPNPLMVVLRTPAEEAAARAAAPVAASTPAGADK